MLDAKPDDLDWLAFCYIADELPRDEAHAFEARLADEQEAREAVARAVELTRAVAAAGATARKRARPGSLVAGAWCPAGLAGRLGWAAVAATVCLAAVLAYQNYRGAAPIATSPQEVPPAEEAGSPGNRSPRLAVLWSRTRENLAALQLDQWAAGLPEEDDPTEEPASFFAEDCPEEDLLAANVPPTWMMAAVRAAPGGPGAENYGPSSPQEN